MSPEDATTAETDPGLAALHRLLAIADTDTGQSRCVANFLLAWWNAPACGGFDLTQLWAVSDPVRADLVAVVALIARDREAPTHYGLAGSFEALVRRWRPHVIQAER